MKKVIFNFRWLKKNKLNTFTELGIDTDNHKIFGVSTELEDDNGNDLCRVPGFVRMKFKEIYLRIWLFKYCFSIGTGEIALEKKERMNFKLLLGFAGKNKKEIENMMDKREMKINFCISKHCFLNCLGCYNNFSSNKDFKCNKLLKFLKFARLHGVEKITLSGGDPLARKDIFKVVKAILNMGFILNLDTVGTTFVSNGVIVNDEKHKQIKQIKNLDIFKKINMIGIPIDGSNNEIQALFRQGRKNLFDEQIKVIEKLKQEGIKVCINTVLHKGNYDDLLNLFEVLKKHSNIVKWQVFQFMPIGPRGSMNADRFVVRDEDFFKMKETVMSKLGKEFEVVFKGGKIRSHNYMLINSSGDAYKVDLENNKETYGNICDKNTWANIMENL